MSHEKITGEVSATFVDKYIDVSGISNEIDFHFRELKSNNPRLTNGDLLVYRENDVVKSGKGNIHLPCMKGKYALYLYLNTHPNVDPINKARTIAPVGVITTTDDYFAFGVMGNHTSLPGIILAPGGAVNLEDVNGEEVNLIGCMGRELKEEMGLSADGEEVDFLRPISFYRSRERHALTIIHNIHLNLDKKQLAEYFLEHNARIMEEGGTPELSDIVVVPNNLEELSKFYIDSKVIDYLPGAIHIIHGH